jgi:hypothetical protein
MPSKKKAKKSNKNATVLCVVHGHRCGERHYPFAKCKSTVIGLPSHDENARICSTHGNQIDKLRKANADHEEMKLEFLWHDN